MGKKQSEVVAVSKATRATKEFYAEGAELPTSMDRSEVARLFRISESSVSTMLSEGVITPIPKVPGVRFSTKQLLELMERGAPTEADLKPLTIRERVKLQKTIKAQQKEIEKLRRVLKNIVGPAMEYITENIGSRWKDGCNKGND